MSNANLEVNTTLKKCPFCGSYALIESGANSAYVYCPRCEARTKTFYDERTDYAIGGFHTNYFGEKHLVSDGRNGFTQAISAWNTRSGE